MTRAHGVDSDNPDRTHCGKWTRTVTIGEPTCHTCLRVSINGKRARTELRTHLQRDDGFSKCGLAATHLNFFSDAPTCGLCRAIVVGRPRVDRGTL